MKYPPLKEQTRGLQKRVSECENYYYFGIYPIELEKHAAKFGKSRFNYEGVLFMQLPLSYF